MHFAVNSVKILPLNVFYEIKPWDSICKPEYHFQIVLDLPKDVHNIIFNCIICLCQVFGYYTRSKMTKIGRSGGQNSPILGGYFGHAFFPSKRY